MSFSKDPIIPRKPHSDENPIGVEKCIARQREKEKKLYPLRIDPRTVILVPKSKCTKKYAEYYRSGKPMEKTAPKTRTAKNQ